jgi:hypothetical protein
LNTIKIENKTINHAKTQPGVHLNEWPCYLHLLRNMGEVDCKTSLTSMNKGATLQAGMTSVIPCSASVISAVSGYVSGYVSGPCLRAMSSGHILALRHRHDIIDAFWSSMSLCGVFSIPTAEANTSDSLKPVFFYSVVVAYVFVLRTVHL